MNRRQIWEPMHLNLARLRCSPGYVQVSVQTLKRITQETPSDQLDTPRIILEATKQATSSMSTVAAPIQSVASAVSGTDNPIALVDWISSFLKTLEKFNGVVDEIATVSITLYPASLSMPIRCLDSSLRASSVDYPLFCFQGLAVAPHRSRNLIYGWQIIIAQAHLDISVCELLSKMDEVYTFLTTAELKAIESMKTIVERITHQTLECSHFIRAYCANSNQKFRKLT